MVGYLRKSFILECKSKVGCQRLAGAVLSSYVKEKKYKEDKIAKLQKTIELGQITTLALPSREKQLEMLRHEYQVFCRFEKSELYDLYASFIDEPDIYTENEILKNIK